MAEIAYFRKNRREGGNLADTLNMWKIKKQELFT